MTFILHHFTFYLSVFLNFTAIAVCKSQPCDAELIFGQTNLNCLSAESYLYCISLEVEDKTDANGNTLSHKWLLGDGSMKPGASVEHCYNEYGDYEVKLVSSRKVNGLVYSDTTVYPLSVGEIALIQEIKEDRFEYFFDGSSAFISNEYTILNYYWDFGDGHFGCDMLESNRYTRPGEYEVKLMVKGVSESGEIKTICGSKKISIR